MTSYPFAAFYGGRKIIVHAPTSYEAQRKAVEHFQAGNRRTVHGHQVTVLRADTTHDPAVLP